MVPPLFCFFWNIYNRLSTSLGMSKLSPIVFGFGMSGLAVNDSSSGLGLLQMTSFVLYTGVVGTDISLELLAETLTVILNYSAAGLLQ